MDNNSVCYVCCRICEKGFSSLKEHSRAGIWKTRKSGSRSGTGTGTGTFFSGEIEFGTMLLLYKTYLLLLLGRDNTGELVEM